MGLSERAAVALLWLLAAFGGLVGLSVDYLNLTWSGPVVALYLLAMGAFAIYLLRIRMYEDRPAAALDSSTVTPLVVTLMYKKQVVEVVVDLGLVAIAYYGAYRLRFDEQELVPNFLFFYRSLPLVLAAQMLALFFMGLYRTVWEKVGWAEIVTVIKGTLLGMFSAELLILHLYRFESYSRALFAIYAVLLVAMLTISHSFFAFMDKRLEGTLNLEVRTKK